MSTVIEHIYRNTGWQSNLAKTPFFEELSHIKGNISRWSSASASCSSNVKVQRGDRNTHSLTLSSSCFSWHHCTQKRNSFFCLPIPLFAQNHSLHQPVSLSESARKRFGNTQTKCIKHPELSSINSSKIMQWGISTAEELWNLQWSKVWDLFSNNRGKKKCFSRAKDE